MVEQLAVDAQLEYEEDVGDTLEHVHQLDDVLLYSNGMLGGSCLLMAIMFAEINRARIGWVEPEVKLPILSEKVQANIVAGGRWELRDDYLPGDVGFDPLGMKPMDKAGLLAMQPLPCSRWHAATATRSLGSVSSTELMRRHASPCYTE